MNFDDSLKDPYLWLEDSLASGTRRWLVKQARLLATHLAHPLRAGIQELVEQLVFLDATDPPFEASGNLFFLRRFARSDHATLYVEAPNGASRALATPETLGKDHYVSIGICAVSPDGGRVALFLRPDGRDEVEIKILNVKDGSVLAANIPDFREHRTSLTADLDGYYFVKRSASGTCAVCYRSLDKPEQDTKELWPLNSEIPARINIHKLPGTRHVILRVAHGNPTGPADYYLAAPGSVEPMPFLKAFGHCSYLRTGTLRGDGFWQLG